MAGHPQNSPRGLFAFRNLLTGGQSFAANSTGVTFSGTLVIGGQATKGLISANSTALTLPGSLKITGAASAATITANSTGIKIGTKYITTNSTGTTIS